LTEQRAVFEVQIVQKPSEEYRLLQADGWEPFWCTIVPLPQGVAKGIISANGKDQMLGGQFFEVVGMRTVRPQTEEDRALVAEAIESGNLGGMLGGINAG